MLSRRKGHPKTSSRVLSISPALVRRLDRRGSRTGVAREQRTNEKGEEAMRFLSMIRVDENTGQQPSERLMRRSAS